MPDRIEIGNTGKEGDENVGRRQLSADVQKLLYPDARRDGVSLHTPETLALLWQRSLSDGGLGPRNLDVTLAKAVRDAYSQGGYFAVAQLELEINRRLARDDIGPRFINEGSHISIQHRLPEQSTLEGLEMESFTNTRLRVSLSSSDLPCARDLSMVEDIEIGRILAAFDSTDSTARRRLRSVLGAFTTGDIMGLCWHAPDGYCSLGNAEQHFKATLEGLGYTVLINDEAKTGNFEHEGKTGSMVIVPPNSKIGIELGVHFAVSKEESSSDYYVNCVRMEGKRVVERITDPREVHRTALLFSLLSPPASRPSSPKSELNHAPAFPESRLNKGNGEQGGLLNWRKEVGSTGQDAALEEAKKSFTLKHVDEAIRQVEQEALLQSQKLLSSVIGNGEWTREDQKMQENSKADLKALNVLKKALEQDPNNPAVKSEAFKSFLNTRTSAARALPWMIGSGLLGKELFARTEGTVSGWAPTKGQ